MLPVVRVQGSHPLSRFGAATPGRFSYPPKIILWCQRSASRFACQQQSTRRYICQAKLCLGWRFFICVSRKQIKNTTRCFTNGLACVTRSMHYLLRSPARLRHLLVSLVVGESALPRKKKSPSFQKGFVGTETKMLWEDYGIPKYVYLQFFYSFFLLMLISYSVEIFLHQIGICK